MSSIAAACAVVGLAACSASETDFKKAAEDAINDADEVEFTDVSCEEPESTEVGTEFWCEATVEGVAYNLPATISGEKEVSVDPSGAVVVEG